MAVAYETKDQEDEHSCFSDNTDADVANNAVGVRMVYLGRLPRHRRPESIATSSRRSTPSSTRALQSQLGDVGRARERVPGHVRDDDRRPEGDPPNEALLAAIVSVEDQGDMIAEAAAALGLEITLEV